MIDGITTGADIWKAHEMPDSITDGEKSDDEQITPEPEFERDHTAVDEDKAFREKLEKDDLLRTILEIGGLT